MTKDAIPTWIVDYFLALPTSDAVHAPSARPAKRRKIETDDSISVAPISVGKGQLSFFRSCQELADAPTVKTIRDVGSHLDFHLRDNTFSIRSRFASALGSFSVAIALKAEDASDDARKILQLEHDSVLHSSPRPLSVVFEMRIERQETAISVNVSLELLWKETSSPQLPLGSLSDGKIRQKVIDAFFPLPHTSIDGSPPSPQDFYSAAYIPPEDDAVSQHIQVSGLESPLFPYQKRSLKWLLTREGVQWSCQGSRLEPVPEDAAKPSIDIFRAVQDTSGRDVFVSDVFRVVSRDPSLFAKADSMVKGGILAEEMGLGKTLEILGLILVHRRPDTPAPFASGLRPSRATLIVTPGALRQQWMSEISRHAPSLRVTYYRGCKYSQDDDEEETVKQLAQHDIVITTYAVLSTELHFALEPPQRPRRYDRAYPRAMSPLVKIMWWRLCLDEAQMIENGYSQAASVARTIPRVNAWGITGTPIKNDVKDLLGLLLFLEYQPFCHAPHVWTTLVERHQRIFRQLFHSIALRHTKEMVQDEIMLPPQNRYVIRVPFTAVEEQHYRSLFKDMAEACDVDLDGQPLVEGWDAAQYVEVMRTWLNRLRQAALHPEIGAYNRQVLGFVKTGNRRGKPIRTVEEVLEAMLEQSEAAVRNEERAYLSSRLNLGQLYENGPRVEEALALWEDVRKETETLVADAQGKFRDVVNAKAADGDDKPDSELEDGENKGQVGEYRRRLRLALEIHHRAVFFCANAYFQMREKAKDGTEAAERLKELEDEGYQSAKAIRREMLSGSHDKAGRLMDKISRQMVTQIPDLEVLEPDRDAETGPVMNRVRVLYGELNEQAKVMDGWRSELVKQLLQPLVDEDDDMEKTGEELGDSATSQDLLLVYYQVLRAAIADRLDAISGQSNELVRHETRTSKRLAQHGDGPAPKSMLALLQERDRIKPKQSKTSMRGAISELRGMRGCQLTMTKTQTQLLEQNKVALALEAEAETFMAAMNARLEYYRQLQAVSDAVLPYEGPRTEEVEHQMKTTGLESRRRLAMTQAKHRYLQNLESSRDVGNEDQTCIICRQAATKGVLTSCGHEFCRPCMKLWFRARRNCPVCQRPLQCSDLHDVTLKPNPRTEAPLPPSSSSSASASVPATSAPTRSLPSSSANDDDDPSERAANEKETFSEPRANLVSAIQSISLGPGPSYPTKIATLVRHILFLRETDPGAKSLIFSQYSEFLSQLSQALGRYHINHGSPLSATSSSDPSVEVFLLHARAHASGLNLVSASHVFLSEPLLSPALEMQAVARVHRIGQRHQSTVWLYLVSGTVEEAIHQRRRRFGAADDVSSLVKVDKSAGELVPAEALWDCLFGCRSSN
ncbi:hypothetical protein L249_4524 [Ophiocordyceps polyrhachis-furcata BCC 54312]|uniref:RING-type domain-containing protein n=1 Tax=Ophiocordyceps polyrhachis-furcata BCC 54312 TaxID=1330021 RepID=A0A367KZ52_9HYPO|nr:hypothetical protein L249_4524 [Ophiocordyceps polyrhachis-furcata BCC 54312]